MSAIDLNILLWIGIGIFLVSISVFVDGFDVSSPDLMIEDYPVLTSTGYPFTSFWKDTISGDLYAGFSTQIFKVDGTDNSISSFAGNGLQTNTILPDGIDVRGISIFGHLYEIWGDGNSLYYCDGIGNGMVRNISLVTNVLGSVAGGGNNFGVSRVFLPGNEIFFRSVPFMITGAENLDAIFIGDKDYIYWYKRSHGTVAIYIGGGSDQGHSGPINAGSLMFDYLYSITYDPTHKAIYFSERDYSTIRMIDIQSFIVTTIAGSFTQVELTQFIQGSLAKDSLLYRPSNLFYASDALYFSDSPVDMFNAIDLQSGRVYRIAGNYGDDGGYIAGGNSTIDKNVLGMDGPASQAKLNFPAAISVDGANDYLLVTDTYHVAVRKIYPSAAYYVPTVPPTQMPTSLPPTFHPSPSPSLSPTVIPSTTIPPTIVAISTSSTSSSSSSNMTTAIIIAVVVVPVVVIIIVLCCCLFYFTRVKEYPTIDFNPPPPYPNASAPPVDPSAPIQSGSNEPVAAIEIGREFGGKSSYLGGYAPVATEVQFISHESNYNTQPPQPFLATAVVIQSNEMSV